jgi:hypothetical protein
MTAIVSVLGYIRKMLKYQLLFPSLGIDLNLVFFCVFVRMRGGYYFNTGSNFLPI